MSLEDHEPAEDDLAALLAACDEALAAGVPASSFCGMAGPPELRPRLERNLACIELLRRAWPDAADTPRTDAAAAHVPAAGIGRFQIRRQLGQGGYGVVFLAYDPQLNREVALKIPRTDTLITPELRLRFHQEARAAAGLDHPHIVPVYEAGEVGPICYIASAYCPGITLADWLRQCPQPVPWDTAADLLTCLADAVQHAHSRGVLHRDLKPANILLEDRGLRLEDRGQRTEDRGQRTEGKRRLRRGRRRFRSVLCPLSSVLCPLTEVLCPLRESPTSASPSSRGAVRPARRRAER